MRLLGTTIRRIPLTQGKVALVDAEDYSDLIQGPKWQADIDRTTGRYYAVRRVWNGSARVKERMSRRIMQAPEGVGVDHRNSNTLDNRRRNLRLSTTQQNCCNRGKNRNNTSGYKGVFIRSTKCGDKYRAMIRVWDQLIHLGQFDSPEDAAKAYDSAALLYHGEFARLNFA